VCVCVAAAGVERRSNAPLAGKEVHVINYCCDKPTQAERDATKQRVGEMLASNGAKQVAAPQRTVGTLSAFRVLLWEACLASLPWFDTAGSVPAVVFVAAIVIQL
jgi:hypothetical protein